MTKRLLSIAGRTLLMLCPACIPGSHANRPPTHPQWGGGLSLELPPLITSPRGPLRILHVSPRGPEQSPSAVSVVFDRPVRALTDAQSTPRGLEIEPPLPGVWKWVGTHAVSFEPASHQFPPATAFAVRISDVQGIDGAHLVAPFSFGFETARPKAEIRNCGTYPVLPRGVFTVSFSQAVDAAEVSRKLHVQARPAKLVANEDDDSSIAQPSDDGSDVAWVEQAIRIKQASTDPSHVFHLRPSERWPVASEIRVVVDGGWKSLQGPLLAEQPSEERCRTLWIPVARLECVRKSETEACPSNRAELVFDNPPLDKTLAHAIRVEPAAAVKLGESNGRYEITGLSPSEHYRVTLPAGLHGTYGGVTVVPQVLEFDTLAAEPTVATNLLRGGQIEPHLLRSLGIQATHTDQVSVAIRSLQPRDILSLDRWGSSYEDRVQKLLEGFWVTHRYPASAGSVSSEEIPLKPWLDAQTATGAILLGADTPEGKANRNRTWLHTHLLKVSDLSLSTKLWLEGARTWVTSLTTGNPVAGAQVTLLRDDEATPLGTTAADGSLVIPTDALKTFWVLNESTGGRVYDGRRTHALLVQQGSDWNLQVLEPGGEVLTWNEPQVDTRVPEFVMFLDRGVYRPGEVVYAKGYLQQRQRGRSLPLERRPLALELSTNAAGSGTGLVQQRVTTNEYGAFDAQFTLPGQIRENRLYVSVTFGSQQPSVVVPISDYRAAEFEVESKGPELALAGSRATFEVAGKYLYGEPMRGALMEYATEYLLEGFAPPGTEGFKTDEDALSEWHLARSKRYVETPTQTTHLTDEGRSLAEISVPANLLGPSRLTFASTVYDAARRGIETRASTLVFPAEYLVGLREIRRARAGRPLAAEVIAVRPDGTRVTGRLIEIELLRLIGKQDDEEEDPAEQAQQDRWVQKRVGRCTVLSGARASGCSLTPPQEGTYILLASSKDTPGRVARAAVDVYVKPAHAGVSDAEAFENASDNKAVVELGLDKTSYHSGEQATLNVHSPFPRAHALVTLERDGVYWSESREVGARSQFSVPLPPEIGPNAELAVLVTRKPGRKSSLAQVAKADPVQASGSIPVRIADDEWRLQVKAKPSVSQAAPGSTIGCDFEVTNRHGVPQPSELTVWAVDDGVLQLSNYQLPNPLAVFARALPLETTTLDSHQNLAWFIDVQRAEFGIGFGAGGVGLSGIGQGLVPESLPRHRGQPTIHFQPHVATDTQGRAHVSLTLPQQLSRFRIMAIAASKSGEFGAAEASVAVRLPLGARPMMPRFARVGDEFEAGVVVAADAAVNTMAKVKVRADGVRPLSETEREIHLQAGRAQEVLFRWRVERPGTGTFRADVTSEQGNDAVAFEVPIRQLRQAETVALYGETTTARAERLGPLGDVTANSAQLQITAANTPLIGLSQAVDQVVNYEHDCTEQLASKLLILGALRTFARDNGAKLDEDSKSRVSSLVRELEKRQNFDGGFRYWDNQADPNPWLTAYVVWVLARTAKAGVPIERRTLKLGTEYLDSRLRYWREGREKWSDSEVAFLADVVAEVSSPDKVSGYLDALIDRKGRLPAFARAWLLHALGISGRSGAKWDRAMRELVHSLLGSLQLSENRAFVAAERNDYGAVLDSPERTLALILRALLVTERNHPLAPSLLRGLLASRHAGSWSSTQSSAWALSTLAEYQAQHHWAEADSVARVWLDDAPLASVALNHAKQQSSFKRSLAQPSKPSTLIFEHQGRGELFYSVELAFERKNAGQTPVAQGFEITHALAPLAAIGEQPEAIPLGRETTVTVGQSLLGEIVLFTPVIRHHVVVSVNLPAGLEPVDPTLTSRMGLKDRSRDLWDRPMSAARDFDFFQRVHDDKVTFYLDHVNPGVVRLSYVAKVNSVGRYRVPPARVEEMYRPEAYGSTAASLLVVAPPVTPHNRATE